MWAERAVAQKRGAEMKGFSIALCLIGVVITALGCIEFYGGDRGLAVAGFVFGVGAGALGVLLFLTDFTLSIFRRSASLMVRFKVCCLRLEVHGELGTPVDEMSYAGETSAAPQPGTWTD